MIRAVSLKPLRLRTVVLKRPILIKSILIQYSLRSCCVHLVVFSRHNKRTLKMERDNIWFWEAMRNDEV